MNDIAIAITNRILEELQKPKEEQDWEENNLRNLWKKTWEELSQES